MTAIALALVLLQQPTRSVAITIDDLPVSAVSGAAEWPAITRNLLAALQRHHVTAVGFVNETKLYTGDALDSSRVALLEQWLAAGQELGNHTFAHREAHTTPLADYLRGIERGEIVSRALARRAGRPFRYFRHPQLHTGRSLAYRDSVHRYLAGRGYTVAPVTVDNQEWLYARAFVTARDRGDSALTQRIVTDYFAHIDSVFTFSEDVARRLFDREIPLVLLLHANALNAVYLDSLLQRLATRGYRFVPLAAALADVAYQSRDNYTGPSGVSWLMRWAEARGIAIRSEPRELDYIGGVR